MDVENHVESEENLKIGEIAWSKMEIPKDGNAGAAIVRKEKRNFFLARRPFG